ncbi:golgin subfamily A member 3-like isoform X2 [Dunckerocampus dactyliophorus]|nr:golgin subfamily A member 3-like isoform X2 [Dunckerocampus dactyliophorus]XP_054621779.1 golgin subfamily A member 3-like isoform X2 [Dunckerocampus dactyliophorus]
MKELTEKDLNITELQASILRLQQEGVDTRAQLKAREARVAHLQQDAAASRDTRDSLRRTSALKEKRTHQLLEDDAHLKARLDTLQSQTSGCVASDVSAALGRASVSLDAERRSRQQIQEQSDHASKEVERLQRELTRVRRNAEKKIEKREIRICALVKEGKKTQADYQEKLLTLEKSLEKLCEERDDLRAKMEGTSRKCVHLNLTRDKPEADSAVSREKPRSCHSEVQSRDQLIVRLRSEMKSIERKHHEAQQQFAASEEKLQEQQMELERLRQQLKGAREELKEARAQAEEPKERAAIFKRKYTAAMEKVHKVQGQVDHLEEELRYSQQQLKESRLASRSLEGELSELKRHHRQKVGQWESSQEALDQLTDELQVSHNLLTESQQKVDYFRSLVCGLQGQVDAIEQQKVASECDLRLYQQSHSHADEDFLSLQSHEEKLQKSCSEQVKRLVECEKVILQMKSELERQRREQASLKRSLVASCRTHLNRRRQLEQEVERRKEEVARLRLELADSQKVHITLLRQSEEELQGARQEVARRSGEVHAHRDQVQRLEEESQEQKEKLKSAQREKQSLSSRVRQLSQELEELRCQHRSTVEELAVRSEEAKCMAARLTEGKQAQDKLSTAALKLEMQTAELKRNLDQAGQDKKDAEAQLETLQAKLEASCSDNANIRHESQLMVTNLKRWIAEQKVSSENLAEQMKTQSKALLDVTEEKTHLQEANDTLKAEVKRLKDVAEGHEREMGRVKAQLKDLRALQDETILEKETCVALNLGRLADMQIKLERNMDAVGLLNQQFGALTEENKRLRRQLAEDKSKDHPAVPTHLLSPFHLTPPRLKQATKHTDCV